MSTSIGDLLSAAEHDLQALDPATTTTSATAIATLAPAARALRELAATHGEWATRRLITTAADQLAATAAAWPPMPARPVALVAAAADSIAVRPPKTTATTWALCVAIADLAHTALDTATSFDLIADHDLLGDARTQVARLHQAAALNPPSARAQLILDELIPHPNGLQSASAFERGAESVVSLMIATRRAATNGRLTLAELLAIAAAAEAATLVIADTASPSTGHHAMSPIEATAWRAAQIACAPFDDGSKRTPPDPSDVLTYARLVTRTLGEGAAPTPSSTDCDHLTVIANQLPLLADALTRAVDNWAGQRHIVALERRLPSFEQRNTVATPQANRIVPVTRTDLAELLATLHDTTRFTTRLAARLQEAIPGEHRRPQPRLTAAHSRTATEDQHTLARRESRARRIADRHAEQWSIPPNGSPSTRRGRSR